MPTGDDLVDVVADAGGAWIASEAPGGTTMLRLERQTLSRTEIKWHVTALAQAADTLWAATKEGVILRGDGSAWSAIQVPLPPPGPADEDSAEFPRFAPAPALAAIWASGGRDIWAVGNLGAIVHYDGARWAAVPSPTHEPLAGVRGRTGSDVWAVGRGVILHWDGSRWAVAHQAAVGPDEEVEPPGRCGTPALVARMRNRARTQLHSILPLGEHQVWVAGGMGRELVLDGMRWREAAIGLRGVSAMWAASPRDAWAVGGGGIAHWDGSAWRSVEHRGSAELAAVHGSGAGDVWAVGPEGRIQHFDGTDWRQIGWRTGVRVTGLWAGGGQAWAGGDTIALLHREQGGWQPAEAPLPAQARLTAVGGVSATDLWAFLAFDRPLHYDGKEWKVFEAWPKKVAVFQVRAAAPDDVWGVGALSLVHWDGTSWQEQEGGEYSIVDLAAPQRGVAWATAHPRDLSAGSPLAGRAFSYDYGKLVLLRWSGAGWEQMAAVPDAWASGIAARGAGEVWVAGKEVLRFNGQAFSKVFADPGGSIGRHRQITVLTPDDIWLSGQGDVLHWDGRVAHVEPVPMVLASLWVTPREVFAFGAYGGIVHLQR